jgi:hypothetical protein
MVMSGLTFTLIKKLEGKPLHLDSDHFGLDEFWLAFETPKIPKTSKKFNCKVIPLLPAVVNADKAVQDAK